MPQRIIAANSFAPGLKTEFLRTYFGKYDGLKAELGRVMRLGLPSDKDLETYFHWESAPHVRRWVRGTSMSSKNFRGVKYTATNFEWARSIPWHFADEADDQTGSMVSQVRRLGANMALLEERVLFQIVTGGTDDELLPAPLPTAPDGQALYSTTNDGSAARFGATNGNSLTGTGTTQAQLRTDFFSVMAQFRLFQDTEGQPLWDKSTLDSPVTIFFAAGGTLQENFGSVFQQEVTHSVISATGAGVSNVIKAMGFNVRLVPTQRLTGNSWYAFLEGSDIKSLFSQMREAPREVIEDFNNSSTTKKTGIKSFGMYSRFGFGVAEPYATIKVTN